MLPVVTVVIPTFNYASHIERAIKSVLDQDYPKDLIQIIVVDDGSTDDTKTLLQPFINSGEISYFFQQNSGKAAATIKGIQESSGEIIFNLDADDVYLPTKVSSTVNVYLNYPEVVHVSSPAIVMVENEEPVPEPIPHSLLEEPINGSDLLQKFYKKNILYGGGSTFSCRRTVFNRYSIPSCADMYIDELLVMVALASGSSYFIKNPLSVWNVHTSNYSIVNSKYGLSNKDQRLLNSSDCILKYLEKENFSSEFVKLYRLKNVLRKLFFKEQINDKQFRDLFQLFVALFKYGPYSVGVLRNYNVINRFLPTSVILLAKKVFKR